MKPAHFRIVLIALLCFACQNSDKDLIPPAEMAKVMADLRILEAGHSLDSNQAALTPGQWKGDYAAVYKKYGVNDSIFRKSYRHYFNRPVEFQRIMEQVISELQGQEARNRFKAQ